MADYKVNKSYKKMSEVTDKEKEEIWQYYKTNKENTLIAISNHFKIQLSVVNTILNRRFAEEKENKACKAKEEKERLESLERSRESSLMKFEKHVSEYL